MGELGHMGHMGRMGQQVRKALTRAHRRAQARRCNADSVSQASHVSHRGGGRKFARSRGMQPQCLSSKDFLFKIGEFQ